jgi:hypothetical protein
MAVYVQHKEDTSIISSQRLLFNEARLAYNATVVDDAIRFVSESEESKDKDKEEQVKSSSSTYSSDSSGNEDDKESKEPDYNDDDENS